MHSITLILTSQMCFKHDIDLWLSMMLSSERKLFILIKVTVCHFVCTSCVNEYVKLPNRYGLISDQIVGILLHMELSATS